VAGAAGSGVDGVEGAGVVAAGGVLAGGVLAGGALAFDPPHAASENNRIDTSNKLIVFFIDYFPPSFV